jgi:predicted DNA-binding transcriptional regulator YafY
VARNAEVVRQWTILREIERSRSSGVTIDDLATLCDVTTRTIRRDLQALEEAGFPVYDDRSHDDGRTRWRLNGQALRGLAAGLTVSELCALYFSRTLLESLAGTPFRADLESAFDKLGAALTPHMQRFLDQLPRVIATKADLARPVDLADRQPLVAKALEATIHHRQARITYHSTSSDRTKVYLVHPYRLAYAQGALYLLAFVPEYGEVRTFAVDRLQSVSLLEERFVPADDVPDGAFAHSLGVHSGPPEHVEVDFAPSTARYIRSREWHPSQRLDDLPDGGVRLTLEVCVDRALRQWVLGFGAAARVASPASLAAELASEHDRAHAQYLAGRPAP